MVHDGLKSRYKINLSNTMTDSFSLIGSRAIKDDKATSTGFVASTGSGAGSWKKNLPSS